MDTTDFAKQHRLKPTTDTDDTTIIPGRNGHIYAFSDKELGVIFCTPATGTAHRILESDGSGLHIGRHGPSSKRKRGKKFFV